MRVAGILRDSIVDGTGIRDVLFLQGCTHRCEGCHNPETWNNTGGYTVTVCDLLDTFSKGTNHITVSGGEPMLQYTELYEFMSLCNEYYNKRFWLYTGFKYEEVPPYYWKQLSKFVDVVVDGRFEIDKKDSDLLFRGSTNQRLIDLPKTVRRNKIVLWEEEY